MSPDPVRPHAGDPRYFGRYHYGANNPYRYSDPDGQAIFVLAIPAAEIAWGAAVFTASSIARFAASTAVRRAGQGVLVGAFGVMNEGPDEEGTSGDTANPEEHSEHKRGKRQKNRLPDTGEPGTVAENGPGTTKKLYGEDGVVVKEWNAGHVHPSTPENEREDHVNDHEKNP